MNRTIKTVCDLNQCAGCMACIDICPNNAIIVHDNLSAYNAVINMDKCITCGMCDRVCPSKLPDNLTMPIKWYQGWALDINERINSSSGGLATAISKAFVESGGAVCSCMFQNGRFSFKIVDSIQECIKFSGSKYVKSDPSGIYKSVIRLLDAGKKVLFIGLPCQVSAMKKYAGNKRENYLFTIDLICHGTPSPRLLELFLKQYNKSLQEISNIFFRAKGKIQSAKDKKSVITEGVRDKYTIAFLGSLINTDNCYACKYAKLERCSDLTLGDSWGSDLPVEDQRKGVSLVLCQSEKGIQILSNAHVNLIPVDLNNAVRYNCQLKHPSSMPKRRVYFFKNITNGKKFDNLVFRCLPKACIRQEIKKILIKCKITCSGGILDYGIRFLDFKSQKKK